MTGDMLAARPEMGLLMVTVPMAIAELRGATTAERLAIGAQAVQFIAEHGDDILFRSKQRGKSAEAFAWLTRALAVGAYQPGGVDFAGFHFCTSHDECEAAARAAGLKEDTPT